MGREAGGYEAGEGVAFFGMLGMVDVDVEVAGGLFLGGLLVLFFFLL